VYSRIEELEQQLVEKNSMIPLDQYNQTLYELQDTKTKFDELQKRLSALETPSTDQTEMETLYEKLNQLEQELQRIQLLEDQVVEANAAASAWEQYHNKILTEQSQYYEQKMQELQENVARDDLEMVLNTKEEEFDSRVESDLHTQQPLQSIPVPAIDDTKDLLGNGWGDDSIEDDSLNDSVKELMLQTADIKTDTNGGLDTSALDMVQDGWVDDLELSKLELHSSTQTDLDYSSQKMQGLKEQIKSLEQILQQKIQEYESKIDQKLGENETLKHQLTELDSVTQRNNELESRIEGLQSDIKNAEAEMLKMEIQLKEYV
jgi:DNA repair exonuclease SbcCD ATPase subunit